MNISDLRDLKLTMEEWLALTAVEVGARTATSECIDMLVLAGLVKRLNEGLALTTDGVEAAAEIDMIFDWKQFAHCPDKPVEDDDIVFLNGEPITRRDALAEALASPKRMTVGSLVRHKTTGGIGLITHHHMWDANWGGFRVQFNKPVDNVIDGRVFNQLTQISDRADAFEFAY